jgi:formamidopyrimidine-DNA glycosylase
MPELPEVETVKNGLEPVLAGQIIAAVALRRPNLRFAFPPDIFWWILTVAKALSFTLA